MYKKCIITMSLGALFLGTNVSAKSQRAEEQLLQNITQHQKEEQKHSPNPQLDEFVKNLKVGKKISQFFTSKVHFIYHEDNRETGSTDGEIKNLDSKKLDQTFKIKVKTDGQGWFPNPASAKTHTLTFNLLKKIKTWDRIEIPQHENTDANKAYIHGMGDSDYLVLHFNKRKQIYKIEYRSEDPG